MKHDSDGLGIQQKINLETGRIEWMELQPHFARGAIINVDLDLDLVETAAAFIEDDSEQILKLLDKNKIWKPDLSEAERWYIGKQEFWAVVVAPWVLIQEIV